MGDADPMIGRTLHGTIEIRRKIGAGGMGNVYEGYQEHLGRAVAVKVMTPEHARNPVAAEYFLREARSASQLRHPNIIQIIDFGREDDNTTFIAMEYVPGRPLSRIIRDEFPLGRDRIVDVLDQTLAALAEAHRKQIVHRDLKPDNLMVEEIDGRDFVKVLDFGIAQSKAPERKAGPLTQQGAVVGTPQYMSPEQAAGDNVDRRSDLFSLGTILYELLTQTSPFDAENLPETLVAVMRHTPQPPSALRPDAEIDPALEAICLRAMKKKIDLRYQTAEEFREALETLTDDAPAEKSADSAPAQFIFRRASGAESREPATAMPSSEIPETALLNQSRKPSGAGLGIDVEDLRGDLLGERTIVTTLVAHQRSHRRIDPEAMSELRERIDEVFEEVAEEWSARIHSRQGSFVTLVFGIPTPRSDDSARAVEAGLALRERFQSLAPHGTVFGFGVAHGELFCPSGDITRAAGAPLDEATEGARSAGDDNLVVVGEELRSRLEAGFRLGKANEEGYRPVLGTLDVSDVRPPKQLARGRSELVGRDAEVATILSVMGRLSKGRGTTLAVVGEPGVGKSALLAEAINLAEQRGGHPLAARWRGSGAEAVRAVRMQWLRDVVSHQGYVLRDANTAFSELGLEREYARLLAAFLDDRLAEVFGTAGRNARGADPDARVEDALRVAMRRLIRRFSQKARAILVLDDLDESDDVAAEFIRHWAGNAADMPIVFATGISTSSPRPLDLPQSAHVIDLKPLAEADALAFLRVHLPSTISESVLARLARISAGFPLHLDHLAHWVRSRDDVDFDEAEQMLAASRDVGELLRMRLFEQPKTVQNVLALMAALGDGCRGNVLIELASDDWEPEAAMQRLLEDGLVEVHGKADAPRLHFRPPALRHVVYDRLSRKMRGRIHRRAAAYFEEVVRAEGRYPSRDNLAALAHHRDMGGDVDGAVAILEQLAARTFRELDYDSGREFLARAIDALATHEPDAVERRCRLELQLVRADAATGHRDEALDRIRGLDRADDLPAPLSAEVRLELARLWLAEEDPELVGRIVKQVLTEVRKLQNEDPDDVELRCLLVAVLQLGALVDEKQGRLLQAADLALEAASLLEEGGIDPARNPWGPSLVWETLNQLGRVRIRLRELPGARKMFDLAMRVIDETGDQRGKVAVRANMATLAEAEGNLAQASEHLTVALREARSLGDPRILAKLQFNRAMILQRQKQIAKAEEAFEESLAIAEDLDWREGIAMNVDRLERLRASMER